MAIAISGVNVAARRWTCVTLGPACRGRRISSGFVLNVVATSGRPIRRPHQANRSRRLSRQRKHMAVSSIPSLDLDDDVDDDPDEDDDFDEDDEESDGDEEEDDAEGDVETWQVASGTANR
jgi:hypothetical protein